MEKISSKSIRELRDRLQEENPRNWIKTNQATKTLIAFDGNVDYAFETLKGNPNFDPQWTNLLLHIYNNLCILEKRIENLERSGKESNIWEEKLETPLTANPYLKKTSKEEADRANPYRKEE